MDPAWSQEEARLVEALERSSEEIARSYYHRQLASIRLAHYTQEVPTDMWLAAGQPLTEQHLDIWIEHASREEDYRTAMDRHRVALLAPDKLRRALHRHRVARFRPVVYQLQRRYPAALPDAIVRLVLQYTL